jgi:hypothetical protein
MLWLVLEPALFSTLERVPYSPFPLSVLTEKARNVHFYSPILPCDIAKMFILREENVRCPHLLLLPLHFTHTLHPCVGTRPQRPSSPMITSARKKGGEVFQKRSRPKLSVRIRPRPGSQELWLGMLPLLPYPHPNLIQPRPILKVCLPLSCFASHIQQPEDYPRGQRARRRDSQASLHSFPSCIPSYPVGIPISPPHFPSPTGFDLQTIQHQTFPPCRRSSPLDGKLMTAVTVM